MSDFLSFRNAFFAWAKAAKTFTAAGVADQFHISPQDASHRIKRYRDAGRVRIVAGRTRDPATGMFAGANRYALTDAALRDLAYSRRR